MSMSKHLYTAPVTVHQTREQPKANSTLTQQLGSTFCEWVKSPIRTRRTLPGDLVIYNSHSDVCVSCGAFVWNRTVCVLPKFTGKALHDVNISKVKCLFFSSNINCRKSQILLFLCVSLPLLIHLTNSSLKLWICMCWFFKGDFIQSNYVLWCDNTVVKIWVGLHLVWEKKP